MLIELIQDENERSNPVLLNDDGDYNMKNHMFQTR